MTSAHQIQKSSTGQHMNIYILVFGWTFFLSFGIFTGSRFSLVSKEILLATVNSRVALDFMIIFRCIIILASLIMTRRFLRWGLLIPSCIRALCYGYLLGACYATWGNAAWLFSLLFYLPNTLLVIADLLFWIMLIR